MDVAAVKSGNICNGYMQAVLHATHLLGLCVFLTRTSLLLSPVRMKAEPLVDKTLAFVPHVVAFTATSMCAMLVVAT